MARNSEIASSEPPGRRRKPTEGGSRLREHFRDSIRDALSGVDVDALQGRRTLPVPTDVSLVTREEVTDLEAELAALRAERAVLEQGRTQRELPAPGEAEAETRASSVPWSPARAMAPLDAPPGTAQKGGRGRRGRAQAGPGPRPAAASPASAAPAAAPRPALPPRPTLPAPPSRPAAPPAAAMPPAAVRGTAHEAPLSDAELESVVAPLLAELASLRDEVHSLRGEPPTSPRRDNRQMVKLVAGVLVGFALIVIALAVVLKA
jgi:hypothetical protein